MPVPPNRAASPRAPRKAERDRGASDAVSHRRAPRMAPAQRREHLLDAALELIAEHGFGAASMEGVARQAQVTKPVVYDAFGSRPELLRALLAREERRAWDALERSLPSVAGGEPLDLFAAGTESFLRAVAERPTTWRLILLPTDETPPVVRAHVERGRKEIADQLATLIAWGAPVLGLKELDAPLAARSLMALAEQWARMVLTDPAQHPPERFGAFVRGLFGTLQR